MFSDDRTFSFKQHSHLCLCKPHSLFFYTNFQPHFAFRLVKHDFALVISHSLILWKACPLRAPVGGYGKGREFRQKSRVISQWLEYSKYVLTKMTGCFFNNPSLMSTVACKKDRRSRLHFVRRYPPDFLPSNYALSPRKMGSRRRKLLGHGVPSQPNGLFLSSKMKKNIFCQINKLYFTLKIEFSLVLYLKLRQFQQREQDERSRLRPARASRIVLLHGLLFK